MIKLKKELERFLVAGLSAVVTDLIMYYVLLNFLTTVTSKAISFLLGTIIAFVINKYWTFEKHEKSIKEIFMFGILYSFTLGINVLTNKIVVERTGIILLGFFIATSFSTILNFLGQKFWVFK